MVPSLVTTVLKFAALVFMSTVGLFYIKSANFTPWNVSGENAIGAIGSGMAIAMFIWYSRNTGHSFFVYRAPFLLTGGALLVGIPVYAAQRGKMTEPPAIPEYR